mmetsp:Transcript_16536/g.27216  ORF Transcript_16536/g.27216 Transcript_16536/m.27216 type:complete len:412 (+) Transcript_16536:244-1479(+)
MASSSSSSVPMNFSSHHSSTTWLVRELLKRTDLSNGDICLFHYPLTQVPYIATQELQQAFDNLTSVTPSTTSSITSNSSGSGSGHPENNVVANAVLVPPEHVERAQAEARSRITRIQFCWYQFPQFPRLMDVYANLQHVDIRQNASLSSIDSIINHVPNLASFNLSDCPNVRTLSPLASAVISLVNDDDDDDTTNNDRDNRRRSRLALKHLWIRGCNLGNMTNEEWANVFDALAESTGPLERLTLSRNNMSYLHGNIGKLTSLTYFFLEDNNNFDDGGHCSTHNHAESSNSGFVIPEEIGSLQQLRFASFCGNNITRLPRQVAHLNVNCDVYLHRNPGLRYPPPQYQKSIKMMRQFFHQERMKLLRGSVLLMPHVTRARWRALERLYQPGGSGYVVCKERFEDTVRRTSIT